MKPLVVPARATAARAVVLWSVVCVFAGGVGCTVDHGAICPAGGEPLRDRVPGATLAERYQPLVVGATWTYDAANTLETTLETLTVEGTEPLNPLLPDVLAYKVVLHRAYGATLTSWWEDRGDEVVRHRELAIDWRGLAYGDERFIPGRNLVDESSRHTTLGTTWNRRFSDVIVDTGGTFSDCKSDAFEVQAVDEMVTVPAGTFSALRIARTDSGTMTWFARGVGKIKHVSATTHDELVSYSIPGLSPSAAPAQSPDL